MKNLSKAQIGAIQKVMRRMENDHDLSVRWIRTRSDLQKAERAGLLTLYKQVFSEPPYNEDFSVDEIKKFFEESLSAGGLIFTASLSGAFNKVSGFVSSVPVAAEKDLIPLVQNFLDVSKTAYFAEDGVARDQRRNGISSAMKRLLLESNWISGFDQVLLRTSNQNYPQISAVTRSGGQVITSLYQQVSSPKQGERKMPDTRSFYLFNSEQTPGADVINRVTIVRPGGNDTAIVWDNVSRDRQISIAKRIQDTYPGVEQVMFAEINPETGRVRGQMAGGEFCGNATRSLGYLLLDGKDGSIDIEVSGASRPMTVTVKDGRAMTEIPVRAALSSVSRKDNGETIVDLEGISFLISYGEQDSGKSVLSEIDEERRKEIVLRILEQNGLTRNPACGLMIVKKEKDGRLYADPYVFVRDTGTLYYESGCGSGSTSVGLMLAAEKGASLSGQEILQPSGMALVVSVERDATSFKRAQVNGPIAVLFDARMYLPQRPIDGLALKAAGLK